MPSGATGGARLAIQYSAARFCEDGTDPIPGITGDTGGTFSSTTGLVFISTSTGQVDLSASTAGTYVVTYTDPSSDTATTSITINALDNAAFAYSASSYEPTDADPTPTITGLTGGTFSSTSGLVFVDSGTNTGSSTGQIDLSASTIASYTITYDTTSSGSSVCPNTSTQTVEIALATLSNNKSIVFDGVDDYIDAGTDSISGALSLQGNFTISFWFYEGSFSNGIHVISRENTSSYGWRVQFDAANIALRANSTTQATKYQTPVPSTNQWHHLVFTYDGGTHPLCYIDGQSVTLTQGFSTWFAPPNNSYNFRIGKADGFSGFSGSIDEVAIWNTALTSTQVSEIYSATGTNVTERLSDIESSNLKLWYRMGDGDTFPTITDNASSNDGTMTNMDSSDIVSDTPS